MKRSMSFPNVSDDPGTNFSPDHIIKKPCAAVSPRSQLISPATSLRPRPESHKQNDPTKPTAKAMDIRDERAFEEQDLSACLEAARQAKVLIDLTDHSKERTSFQNNDHYIYNVRRCSKTNVLKSMGRATTGRANLTVSMSSGGSMDQCKIAEHDGEQKIQQDAKQVQKVAAPVVDLPPWSPLPGCRGRSWSKKAIDGAMEFFSLTPNSFAPRPRPIRKELETLESLANGR
ncbi:hypothetical protein SVAN01_09371 [Stagonosporopsis vannaccii]|nr:hypothetical protein SVAN01_09371 [Stagonosporopsis vannaccii]